MTTVLRNPHDCCSPEVECECCNGDLGGAIMTVSGIKDGDRDCPCTDANTTYVVPRPGDLCQGHLIFPKQIECPNNWSIDIELAWRFSCNEEGYWLTIGFGSMPEIGPPRSALIFLGTTKPTCTSPGGSVTFSGDPQVRNGCDAQNSVTIDYSFY